MNSVANFIRNHRIFARYMFIAFCGTLLIFFLFLVWLKGGDSNVFRMDLKRAMLDKLIFIKPPPSNANVDVIYTLGGSPNSLEFKYRTAAQLFHKKIGQRIWILSKAGKTEYNFARKRNLTSDEWSIMKLKEFGVPEQNIEVIQIKEGFFGTFSEAKNISSLLKIRGYKSIVLISSVEHTYRAGISFDNFLKNQNISIYTQNSAEGAWLRHLIVEFIKLKVYQYLLIENQHENSNLSFTSRRKDPVYL